MEKKIIIIPPCFTYGDILSIISMVYFLTKYYDKVYLYIMYESINYKIINYYKLFFENCEDFNKKIFIIENNQINKLCKDVSLIKTNFIETVAEIYNKIINFINFIII